MAVRDPVGAPVLGNILIEAEPVADPAAPASPAEAMLGHRFKRPQLLREALTHRSAVRPGRGGRGRGIGSNERLEFVGDRVLGLLIAEWLAERFPVEQEGELGRRLAHLVSQPVLAVIAEEVGLPDLLAVAPGESRAGVQNLATVVSDATEAAIGALYLDGGIDAARGFVRRAWSSAMTAQAEPPKDAKTALQEWAQGRGFDLPSYDVALRDGPPHAPEFTMSVTVAGQTGTGTAGIETRRRTACRRTAASNIVGE